MSRTTTSKVLLVAAVCAAAAWAGCSKRYPQRELARNGPIGQQVWGMAAALQKAGPEGLDKLYERQAASGLTPQQERSLRAAMLQIAKAQKVEVQDLARFGKNVYRASLRLRSAGGTSSEVCMLLVRSNGALRWAGQN
jgi:hypothetical protein